MNKLRKDRVIKRQMNMFHGERLKEVMEEKGITQKELCKLTGISTTTLSNAMNDISRSEYDKEQGVVMKCNNLIKICNVLNVSADYLLGISKASAIDVSLKDISEKTNLSEKTINTLSSLDDESISLIEDFIKMIKERKAICNLN